MALLPETQDNSAPPPRWQLAVTAGILGWIADAFDFFVIVFLFDTLAAHFAVSKKEIVATIALTLVMRPVGALLFGTLADRFGRRRPMMLCVAYFSICSVASAFAPTYAAFAALRALYGIGMGGYWGIGASYAMEASPARRRGLFSGIMQAGYPLGYLLAALGMALIAPSLGWRSLFVISAAVSALIIGLTFLASESHTFRGAHPPTLGHIFRTLGQNWKIFLYLLAVMTGMICLSHGTQDLYPDFLKSLPGVVTGRIAGMKTLFGIPVLYNVGAIVGALFFGELSQRIGRRYAILAALALCLVAMAPWAFGTKLAVLAAASFVMQAGVQGAFGVIPIHLNELSPGPIRSLFPGFVYQLGVFLASPAVSVEYLLRDHLGYPRALSFFELGVVVTLTILFLAGPERRGRALANT